MFAFRCAKSECGDQSGNENERREGVFGIRSVRFSETRSEGKYIIRVREGEERSEYDGVSGPYGADGCVLGAFLKECDEFEHEGAIRNFVRVRERRFYTGNASFFKPEALSFDSGALMRIIRTDIGNRSWRERKNINDLSSDKNSEVFSLEVFYSFWQLS